MIQAGVDAGYGSDRADADAQRAFWGPVLDPLSGRLWRGRPRFYVAQYGYARYHTLQTVLEVGWEEAGAARLKGLLRIGNGSWQGQPIPGYPVNRVKSFTGHYVTAWGGRTAAERRRSRVELWEKQERFLQGILYPQTEGRDSYLVAVDKEASRVLDEDPEVFLSNLRKQPGIDARAIETFVGAGPEVMIVLDRGNQADAPGSSRIRHGIGFRFRIPYRRPQLVDVRLNGHALAESPDDGFQSWFRKRFYPGPGQRSARTGAKPPDLHPDYRLPARRGPQLRLDTPARRARSAEEVTARGKSRHGIRPSLHPGGLRCDSGTYSRYAPESRLVRRAQERSRCSRDFHHGLLRVRKRGTGLRGITTREAWAGAVCVPGAGS